MYMLVKSAWVLFQLSAATGSAVVFIRYFPGRHPRPVLPSILKPPALRRDSMQPTPSTASSAPTKVSWAASRSPATPWVNLQSLPRTSNQVNADAVTSRWLITILLTPVLQVTGLIIYVCTKSSNLNWRDHWFAIEVSYQWAGNSIELRRNFRYSWKLPQLAFQAATKIPLNWHYYLLAVGGILRISSAFPHLSKELICLLKEWCKLLCSTTDNFFHFLYTDFWWFFWPPFIETVFSCSQCIFKYLFYQKVPIGRVDSHINS